jgi:hypothetical protein
MMIRGQNVKNGYGVSLCLSFTKTTSSSPWRVHEAEKPAVHRFEYHVFGMRRRK